MGTLLSYIRTRIGEENLIDNNSKSLSRDRCRVDLTGVPPDLIIVDMDAVFPSGQEGQKICDYVIFLYERSQNTYVVVPMELKSGQLMHQKSPNN